jgi:hypothetical protein
MEVTYQLEASARGLEKNRIPGHPYAQEVAAERVAECSLRELLLHGLASPLPKFEPPFVIFFEVGRFRLQAVSLARIDGQLTSISTRNHM